jgi:membrane protease YdiL (CAAX protease family)
VLFLPKIGKSGNGVASKKSFVPRFLKPKVNPLTFPPPLDAIPELSPKEAALSTLGLLSLYFLFPLCVLSIALFASGARQAEDIPRAFESLLAVIGYFVSFTVIFKRYLQKGISIPMLTRFSVYDLRKADGFDDKKTVAKLVKYLIAGITAGIAVSALLTILPDGLRDAYDDTMSKSYGKDGYSLSVVLAVLFSPVSEEFIFRGILFTSLRRGFNSRICTIAISAVFGLFHLNPLWSIYAFGFGLLFSVIRIETNNIIPTIAMHFGVNLSAIIGIFLKNYDAIPESGMSVLAAVLIMLIFGGLSVSIMKNIFESFRNGEKPE